MWRRWKPLYLLLLALRLYFALSPSYIHPDEHFQGPEVLAGDIFSWRAHKTWEFTSDTPIRSFFPLWFAYGIPMQLLHWIIPGAEPPSPELVFYGLRVLFFLMSFVLEDWALQDLLPHPRHRAHILLLLSSSYVTWTYQTHTFSNSLETITVLWALVLISRISRSRTPAPTAAALLGIVSVFGVFNRITFPAFLLLPATRLLPHFRRNPLTLLPLVIAALATACYAVYLDTLYYTGGAPAQWPLNLLPWNAVVTPLNNIIYNIDPANLALHGTHPRYTHLLLNLPQLLGPALLALRPTASLPFLSAAGGVLLLSLFAHQEARFLIPAVPLLLTCVPQWFLTRKRWVAGWVLFNVVYGVLMGVFHQGGVVPAQLWLGKQEGVAEVVFWKTYSPPVWVLGTGGREVDVRDLMGAKVEAVKEVVRELRCKEGEGRRFVVMPRGVKGGEEVKAGLREVWEWRRHVGLDDMDWGEDGVVETVKRVVGERGLGVWEVVGECEERR